jgi:hypothetical protein
MIVKKLHNQNIFDFIISNYGSLEYIYDFLIENNISDILTFGNAAVGTGYKVTPPENQVVKSYTANSYAASTGANPPTGDFNTDFNLDFFA